MSTQGAQNCVPKHAVEALACAPALHEVACVRNGVVLRRRDIGIMDAGSKQRLEQVELRTGRVHLHAHFCFILRPRMSVSG